MVVRRFVLHVWIFYMIPTNHKTQHIFWDLFSCWVVWFDVFKSPTHYIFFFFNSTQHIQEKNVIKCNAQIDAHLLTSLLAWPFPTLDFNKFKFQSWKFKLLMLEIKRFFFCILHTKNMNCNGRHSQGIYVARGWT